MPAQTGGGDGDDYVLGGDGDDVLTGGAGTDILCGGDGADVLIGDAGADWFVFAFGDTGRDTVLGFDGTEDGIALSGFGPGAGVTLTQSALSVILAVDGQEVAIIVGADTADVVEGVNLFFHDLAYA